jgi:hypothetical protein
VIGWYNKACICQEDNVFHLQRNGWWILINEEFINPQGTWYWKSHTKDDFQKASLPQHFMLLTLETT